MTVHAEEEMAADGLTVFDVECALLTGRIVQRQRASETGEWKYVMRGRGIAGFAVGVIAKLSKKRTPVVITVYGAKLTNGRQR